MNEETNNQDHTVSTSAAEPTADTTTPTEATAETSAVDASAGRRRNLIIGAIVAVIALLAIVWYAMESTDRVDTSVFSFIEKAQLERQVVATVNEVEISAYDLAISKEQISAAAGAQGLDLADPDVQSSITEQSIEMLINTELLRQEANRRGISATDEEVEARYEQLIQEVGGEAVLLERMEQFGVTEEILMRDIRNELTIQALLDEVFAETTLEVDETEVAERYELAGGEEAGLPPLEEVREQIEAQLETEREQSIVNDFVESLRNEASIDVQIEL